MKIIISLMIVAFVSILGLASVQARSVFDWEATELNIQLGTNVDDLVIVPNYLRLEGGALYKLNVHNPSSLTHTLVVDQLGKAGLTTNVILVEMDPAIPAKPVVENVTVFPYKAQVIKVESGETVEWYFMPMTKGKYSFKCGNPTHTSAGMKATIEVI